MKYLISSTTPPPMPKLGKGLECISLLVSRMSSDMRECVVPMLFPALATHISNTKFLYCSNVYMELCGEMAIIIAHSGDNKGQFTPCANAIMRFAEEHDSEEMRKYLEYQKAMKTTSANKTKPEEVIMALIYPPSDTSSPAFYKNAMALEAQGKKAMYFNLPEVEMAMYLAGGKTRVSQIIRNCYDVQKGGQIRATTDGTSCNCTLRVNMTFSSTPLAARKFFKNELLNGTLGRIVVSYKPRRNRVGKIPRVQEYDDSFFEKLDVYLARLDECKGRFIVPQLNKIADKLAAEFAEVSDLADDDILFEMSHRSIVNAWKAGCICWLMNGQVWTRAIGELVEWLAYHDLYSKMAVFSDMLKSGDTSTSESGSKGPCNMLEKLEDSFSETMLETLRVSLEKSKEGTKHQLSVWLNRGYIEYSSMTGMYTKTEKYLKRK